MQINWTRTILAGLAGTLGFDGLGFLLTGQWWDIPSLLGAKMGTGLLSGVLAHYGNGAILAIIYASIAPSLWGPNWTRALIFTSIETIFGVWFFMLPLLGLGVAGIEAGALIPVITLVRHWGFGLVLAGLIPPSQPVTARQMTGRVSVATASSSGTIAKTVFLNDKEYDDVQERHRC